MMTIKDLILLENLLEEFCTKSNYCKDCPFKHNDKDRSYCNFGVVCILKELKINT